MKFAFSAVAALLTLSALPGCMTTPHFDPPEQSSPLMTGIAEPLVFNTTGEAVDIDGPMGDTLTLSETTILALRHDPRIQSALSEVRQAQAESKQQRLLPNPILSIGLRFPQGGGKPIIDAGLTADLISLLKKPGQISIADNRLRAACSEALTTVLNVVSEAQQQYATAQSLDAELEILKLRRGLLTQLLDLAKSRVEAGEASQLDVLTAQSERVSLDEEVIERTSEQRQARLALARIIGVPSGTAGWTLAPLISTQELDFDETIIISAALQHRPEIQSQVWELGALGEEVKLTRLSPWDGSEVGVNAERDGDWSVGPAVSLPIPLLDWGQANRDRVEAARINARHKLTATRRQVVQEVRIAVEQLHSARAALSDVQRELIPLQEARRNQAEAAYKAGVADITVIRLAEQDLQASRSKLIELQRKVSIARIDLDRAVGGAGIYSGLKQASRPTTTQSTK